MSKRAVFIAVCCLAALCTSLFSANLAPQTPVNIVMDASVMGAVNVAGNSLGFVAGWRDNSMQGAASFSSDNGQTWSPPASFGSALSGLSSVDIAAQDSRFLAVWIQNSEGPSSIFSALSTDGTTWEPPVSVFTALNIGNLAPVAANDAGFMVVLSDSDTTQLKSTFSSDGTTWGSAVVIPAAFTPSGALHSVAGNDDDGFLAGALDDATDDGYTFFSSNNGASWGMQVSLNTNAQTGVPFVVGANSSGFLAAWIDNTAQTVFTSFSTDNGASWSTPVQIPTAVADVNSRINISANNNAFAVTWVNTGSFAPMASCSQDNGASWSTPVSISSAVSGGAFDPRSVDIGVFQANAMFTWRDTSNNAVSSYSVFPFSPEAGAPPPAQLPFFKQVSPNHPGGKVFE